MTIELLLRYFHFIGIFLIASSLFTEHMMISPVVDRSTIKKLARIDGLYGFASILVLGTGLTMWLWVGKPAAFYSHNPALHIKLTLFLIMGILSIAPTIFFLKQRKGAPSDKVTIPKKYILMIRIELLILFLIPIFGIMIARGLKF